MPVGSQPPVGRYEQIVQAAQTCLARDGYASVSIKDISREAGVAPGLVHYYFENKEDLLVAAVRAALLKYRQEFFTQLSGSEGSAEGIRRSIEWAGGKLRDDPAWFMLLIELYSLSLRDDRIKAELHDMLREEREVVTDIISALLPAPIERLGVTAESLGTLLLAVFDGVVIHALVDPTVDPVQNLSTVARAVIALLPQQVD